MLWPLRGRVALPVLCSGELGASVVTVGCSILIVWRTFQLLARLVGTTAGQRPKRRIGQNGVPGGLIPTGRFAGTWRPGYQTPQVKVTACLVRSPLSQSTSKVSSDSPALLEPQNQPSVTASDASSGKLPASMTAES